jgi:hypothetical protein
MSTTMGPAPRSAATASLYMPCDARSIVTDSSKASWRGPPDRNSVTISFHMGSVASGYRMTYRMGRMCRAA